MGLSPPSYYHMAVACMNLPGTSYSAIYLSVTIFFDLVPDTSVLTRNIFSSRLCSTFPCSPVSEQRMMKEGVFMQTTFQFRVCSLNSANTCVRANLIRNVTEPTERSKELTLRMD